MPFVSSSSFSFGFGFFSVVNFFGFEYNRNLEVIWEEEEDEIPVKWLAMES